jgi:hypothetical protein
MKTKKLAITLFSLITAAVLAGCGAGASTKITKENYDKIKEGMAKTEVLAILGEPTGSELLGQVQDQELRGPVWQGRGFKIVVGFDDDGKLLAKRLDTE